VSETQTQTFDHIPELSELLRGDGIPGFRYYHVANDNAVLAQEAGLRRVEGLDVYAITGPKGDSCSTILMCQGERIPGARESSSKRELLVDDKVYRVSGIPRPKSEDTEKPAPEKQTTK
jgi:hypothetical protein